jgi:hypothetical protein
LTTTNQSSTAGVDAKQRETTAVAWTARRRTLALTGVLVAGVVAFFPAIRARYVLDDYLHASMFHGTFPGRRGPFDLYDFVSDADRAALTQRGMLPWWTDPHLKIRFFRPLSSALVWGEHLVLGDGPLLLHVSSFLWWCALVLSVRRVFTRIFAPRPALVATAIFALAPCHAIPLAWIANREALVSLTFGALGLAALLRMTDAGRLRQAPAAALFFALSLLAGEYGLAIGAYVVALALSSRARSLRVRAAAIAAFAVPALAYLACHAALGYGTAGSGFYTDPFGDPLGFLRHVPRRAATLLLDAWCSLDGETLPASTSPWLLGALLAAGVAAVAWAARRAIAALPDGPRRDVRWLLVGSLVALVPVLAVVPSPRLLGANMIGTSAAVAAILEQSWFSGEARSKAAERAGLVALALGFAHLVHGPATSWLVSRDFERTSRTFEASAKRVAARAGEVSKTEIFVMRGGGGSWFLPFALAPDFSPPARWRLLAQTGHVLALRRDARTLDLVAAEGQGIYPGGAGNLFLSERTRVAEGQTYALPDGKITILRMNGDMPRVVRLTADRDLDAYDWIAEERSGFRDVAPPGVGFGRPFDP